MKKMKIGIICYPRMELDKIKLACEDNNVDFVEINIMSPEWMVECQDDIDGYLIRPPCSYQEHKCIFDERIYFLNEVLGKPIYPSFKELYTYENKRNMHLFLSGHGIRHANTKVYMRKEEALVNLDSLQFPIVSKSNIGASGSAVQIIKNKRHYVRLVNQVFGRFSPELSFGWFPVGKKCGIPLPRFGRAQKHYLLTQEFLNIKWEWRMIRIGDSYIGHQKLLGDNGFASGSELVGWERPSDELLWLLHNATEKMGMRCMTLDIFETANGEFYVNEMQAIIGAYRPYQMKVDGKPGRFILRDGEFQFEEGIHCQNACWNPRVEDFIRMLNGDRDNA
ncbi:ATP-grasp domain-containing protein [Shewanella oncorhynchi]|uniref:ATP-grasp domain-containing protein n=1 Tax=Shewanella oncorhynchi TaxID=2726434 RepID=UPI003D793FC8